MDHCSERLGIANGQTPAAPEALAKEKRAANGPFVACDLPLHVSVAREEIAIVKAFLSDDIRAIIEGDNIPVTE